MDGEAKRLAAPTAIAFLFPIEDLPGHPRTLSALGRRAFEARCDARADLEIASLAGDGDESPANVENEEAPSLLVVRRCDELPGMVSRVGVGVLDLSSRESLRLREREEAAIALLRLKLHARLRLRHGDPACLPTPVTLGAHPDEQTCRGQALASPVDRPGPSSGEAAGRRNGLRSGCGSVALQGLQVEHGRKLASPHEIP